ncbi:unnamed protein product [Phytomonas sp. EM1]|nr:unnamed protein product [Phytomonas sp. EM1]|eukprot:CCW65073.1 unnamed protein product [Phytomonas sp. isolate EM1]
MHFDKVFLIELGIAAFVITFGVLLYCFFPHTRMYIGVLLLVTLIYITRAWRLLPSHKRWLEEQVEIEVSMMRGKARTQAASTSNAPYATPNDPIPQPEAGNCLPWGAPCVDPRLSSMRGASLIPSTAPTPFPPSMHRGMPRPMSRPPVIVEPPGVQYDVRPAYFPQFPPPEMNFDARPEHFSHYPSPLVPQDVEIDVRQAYFSHFSPPPSKLRYLPCAARRVPPSTPCAAEQIPSKEIPAARSTESLDGEAQPSQ